MTASSTYHGFYLYGVDIDTFITDLAVIFRPGMMSHPDHEQRPQDQEINQKILEFLIAQQDWFILEIPPPSRRHTATTYAKPIIHLSDVQEEGFETGKSDTEGTTNYGASGPKPKTSDQSATVPETSDVGVVRRKTMPPRTIKGDIDSKRAHLLKKSRPTSEAEVTVSGDASH